MVSVYYFLIQGIRKDSNCKIIDYDGNLITNCKSQYVPKSLKKVAVASWLVNDDDIIVVKACCCLLDKVLAKKHKINSHNVNYWRDFGKEFNYFEKWNRKGYLSDDELEEYFRWS